MSDKTVVHIVCPTDGGCDHLKGMLEEQPEFEPRAYKSNGGQMPPLLAEAASGVLVLDLGEDWRQTLRAMESARSGRLAVIAIGPENDVSIMRAAMQVGARDYLTQPVNAEELLAAIRSVAEEVVLSPQEGGGKRGEMTAVINAKGGSGASFIATNLAYILNAEHRFKTALLDMDLQFGCLPLALDLNSRDTLFDALAAADHLDPVALQGYMTKHESGLHVLGAMTEQLSLPWEVSVDDLHKVLQVAGNVYDQVVLDLPRQIDPLTSLVLESCERILLVMQQSFTHLRDAKHMYSIMVGYLGIPKDRIHVIANRHHDKNPVTLEDIRNAISPTNLHILPNDFWHVTESQNLGVPLYKGDRNAPITKALIGLSHQLHQSRPEQTTQKPAPKGLGKIGRVLGI